MTRYVHFKIFYFLTVFFLILALPITSSEAQNFAAPISQTTDETTENAPAFADPRATQPEQNIPTLPSNPALTDLAKMESEDYVLGKTDVLEIDVIRHPEVSGEYIINNEGSIQYEFVGDLKAEGLTKKQLQNLLIKKLSEYIISPQVTVKITGYNSKTVYVIGEVARPGKIFMRGNIITVHEALIQAGLPLLSAKMTNARLITPSLDGKAKERKIDIHKLLIRGDLRENLVMMPGDTLYVPPTVMARVMRTIQPIAAPIGTVSGTARSVTAPGL